MPLSKEDFLFGRIAVLNNIITQEQLDEAIAIQKSRPYFSPIAIILLHKNYISRQHLQTILETQKKRLPRPAISPQEKREDLIFAYLAEKLQYTNIDAIYDAIGLQTQMVKRGLLLRLFEVLVNQGYLLPKHAEDILTIQEQAIISCPDCDTKYNILGLQTSVFVCKKCNAELHIPETMLALYDAKEIEELRKKLDEMAKQETLMLLRAELAPLRNKKQLPELPTDDKLHLNFGVSETSDEDVMEELLGEPINELEFITAGEVSAQRLEEHKYTDEWYWSRDIMADMSGETSNADQGSADINDEDTMDIHQWLHQNHSTST